MHDNTILAMVTSNAKFLQEKLSNMRLLTKNGTEKAPTVHEGSLPPKVNTRRGEEIENDDYPFVIVRFLDEEDEINGDCLANFRIIIGTYNEDEQNGWKDVASVINRIKIELKRTKFIGSGELVGKIESAIFEEQRKPTWHGIMDVSFQLPQVQLETGVIDNGFFD